MIPEVTHTILQNPKICGSYYPLGLQLPGRVFVSGSRAREGYTGYELDPETGDYYAGARYYLPELGRWAAVDPMAEKYYDLSPYNYGGNNSLSYVDPGGDTLRYTGSTSYQNAARGAVQELREIPLFNSMINTLASSTQLHVIGPRSTLGRIFGGPRNPRVEPNSIGDFYSGTPQGSEMKDWTTVEITRDGVTMDATEAMGHELIHMFVFDQGLAGTKVKAKTLN